MIRFSDVSKRYPGGFEALSGVSFHLAPGEMAFLTGHSGAGKSTLLKLIALIERSSGGQVIINGQNLAKVGRRKTPFVRRDIGVIFQDHRLLFDRTVFDNVALPLIIAGHNHQEIGRRVRAALDKVGLLSKEKVYPITLSGGEQQRVGIARAVVNKPPLLLADEPTGNLDGTTGKQVIDLLFRLHESSGTTFLLITHDPELARRCDRIITLVDGEIAGAAA